MTPLRTKYDAVTDVDAGQHSITNKRLVFVGAQKSNAIAYGRIVSFEVFEDALVVYKTSGPAEYYQMAHEDAEYASAVIGSLN